VSSLIRPLQLQVSKQSFTLQRFCFCVFNVDCYIAKAKFHRIIESLRLEITFKIESSR